MGCDLSFAEEKETLPEAPLPWPAPKCKQKKDGDIKEVNDVLLSWALDDSKTPDDERAKPPVDDLSPKSLESALWKIHREAEVLAGWQTTLVGKLSAWIRAAPLYSLEERKILKRLLGSMTWLGRSPTVPEADVPDETINLEREWISVLKKAARGSELVGGRVVQKQFEKFSSEPGAAALLAVEPKEVVESQLDGPVGEKMFKCARSVRMLINAGEEFTPKLESYLRETLASAKIKATSIIPGPPKTPERFRAKSQENRAKFLQAAAWPNGSVWANLVARSRELKIERNVLETIAGDYVVKDVARCSVAFSDAASLVRAIEALKSGKHKLVGLKNGYSRDAACSSSGYRDVKIILRFRLDEDLRVEMGRIRGPIVVALDKGDSMLVEVQLLLDWMLDCKKASSMTYKIRRAETWPELCKDFKKYNDE